MYRKISDQNLYHGVVTMASDELEACLESAEESLKEKFNDLFDNIDRDLGLAFNETQVQSPQDSSDVDDPAVDALLEALDIVQKDAAALRIS